VNRELKKYLLTALVVVSGVLKLSAQEPLYIVNGEPREEIETINPELIEQIEQLPADEQTIARFGPKAGNGVVLVTLKFDRAPRFLHPEGLTLAEYVRLKVQWQENDPTARIVIRYRITREGQLEVDKVLEATDKRLLRRVSKALADSPRWEPARKAGEAVATDGHVLRLTLPEGREMPPERYIIIR